MDKLHRLDPSRAVTAGANLMILLLNSMGMDLYSDDMKVPEIMDSTKFNEMAMQSAQRMNQAALAPPADQAASPFLDLLDIAGYNYGSLRYPVEGQLHPDRIVVGSETYIQDLPTNWEMVKKYPYVVGDFMWTAWDYLGEVGIGAWSYEPDAGSFTKGYPWLLADAGAFDILGHDNAEAGMASVIWGARKKPYIGVVPVNRAGQALSRSIWRGTNALPMWSYSGCEGNMATVEVYSDADHIKLYLNGLHIETKPIEQYKAVFCIPYQPGTLEAVAYDAHGNVLGAHCLRSAVGKPRIAVREWLVCKDGAVRCLDILITGENGQIECNADTALTIDISGGLLLGYGSANPKTEESFLSGTYTTWYGRSQAIIRPTDKTVTIMVSGDGLDTAVYTLEA